MKTKEATKPKEIQTPVIFNKLSAQEAIDAAEKTCAAAERYEFAIFTQADYDKAGEHVKAVKRNSKAIVAEREKFTKPHNAAKDVVLDWFRPSVDKLKATEDAVKKAMNAFNAEKERIASEAQTKVEALIKKEADRQIKLAEKRAETAAKSGNTKRAEEIRETAQADAQESKDMAFAPVETSTKTQGISGRSVWKGRVTDKMALLKAIVEGGPGAPGLDLIDVIEAQLNAVARAHDGNIKYPGVTFYEEKNIAVRA